MLKNIHTEWRGSKERTDDAGLKIERCGHRQAWKLISHINLTVHGFPEVWSNQILCACEVVSGGYQSDCPPALSLAQSTEQNKRA